jgi:hypothetical protein
MRWLLRHVRNVPILLQKSKIERRRKSREGRFLDAPAAARLSGANTKVGRRFGRKRCGPSSRRARSASAVFKIFVLHPKNTFATISATTGLMHRSNLTAYSITSSARSKKASGIVMPSAFAVVRLTTSSKVVGCSTGRSAGFAPFKILSTRSAARRNRSVFLAP